MVIILRQYCCGCSLKTGTIIIGALNALYGFGCLIVGSTEVAAASSIRDEEYRSMVIFLNLVVAVLSAIMLMAAFCLIIGAIKGIPVLLLPWMVYVIFLLVGNTVILILLPHVYFFVLDVVAFIGYIIYMLVDICLLVVVDRLYREMKGIAPPNAPEEIG